MIYNDCDITGKKFTRTQIFVGVAHILSGYNFAEKINLDDRLSNMFIFRDDTNSIKHDILKNFEVNIDEDILFMTVRDLCDKIINALPEIGQEKNEIASNVIKMEKRFWTSRQIYGLIFCRLGRVVKRSIKTTETVQSLIDEVSGNSGLSAKLDRQLRHIESVFNIKISLYMTLDEIGQNAQFSMIQSGRMLSLNDSNLTDEEKLWRFLIGLVPVKVFTRDVVDYFPGAKIDRGQFFATKNFEDLKRYVLDTELEK